MILVLGGGWTGSRICARDPSKFITTSRSEENIQQFMSLGLNAVQFDLMKEDTWSNLPPKDSIQAIIITFPVLTSHLAQWESLWDRIVAAGCPVLCYGTSSVFEPLPVVNETSPLTGQSMSGSPQTDRVKGEEWMLARGAVVLHLSGLASDDVTNERYPGLGSPRTIKLFMSPSYYKSGYKLINLIHINDIYQISLILIDEIVKSCSPVYEGTTTKNGTAIRGQRVLASCGAFRVQEFFKAFDMEPLPEISPQQGMFMEGHKIISIAKLLALLPEDYQWTLPLAGVKPVSRGLPMSGSHGAAHDRHWELKKMNFCGKWQGKSKWYKRDKGEERGGKMDHGAFIAELNGKVLPAPDFKGDDCTLNIYCIDNDTLVWHGTGLHSTPSEKKFQFGRKDPVQKSFIFPGLGGWCSQEISNKNDLYIEVNFFYKRARSMIIAKYSPLDSTSSDTLLLDAIANTPFRCGHGCDIPLKPSQHEARGEVDTLIQSLQGRCCQREWMMPVTLELTVSEDLFEYPTESIKLFSADTPGRVVQLFDDDIVCSIPSEVSAGRGCDLVFGCFHTNTYAQFVTVTYDSQGKVQKYLLEKWNN